MKTTPKSIMVVATTFLTALLLTTGTCQEPPQPAICKVLTAQVERMKVPHHALSEIARGAFRDHLDATGYLSQQFAGHMAISFAALTSASELEFMFSLVPKEKQEDGAILLALRYSAILTAMNQYDALLKKSRNHPDFDKQRMESAISSSEQIISEVSALLQRRAKAILHDCLNLNDWPDGMRPQISGSEAQDPQPKRKATGLEGAAPTTTKEALRPPKQ